MKGRTTKLAVADPGMNASNQWRDRGETALPLLMSEWAVLMGAIRLRLDRIECMDPGSLDEDARADLYKDKDTLTRALAYIESNFARTFGGSPAQPKGDSRVARLRKSRTEVSKHAMMIRIAMLLLVLDHTAVASTLSDKLSACAVPTVVPESVEIVRNGAWSADISGDETADMCRTFVLRRADVSAFFKRADRVTERAYSHDLDAARCYAEGEARLAGGGAAKWTIDQARRGFISMHDGRTIYLYCPKCRADVFAPN